MKIICSLQKHLAILSISAPKAFDEWPYLNFKGLFFIVLMLLFTGMSVAYILYEPRSLIGISEAKDIAV